MEFNRSKKYSTYGPGRGAAHAGYRVRQPYQNDYQQGRSQKFTYPRRSNGSSSSFYVSSSVQRLQKPSGVYRNPYFSTNAAQIHSKPHAASSQSRVPTLLERLSMSPVGTHVDMESDIASSGESSPVPSLPSRTLGTTDISVGVIQIGLSTETADIISKAISLSSAESYPFEEAHLDVEEGEIFDIPGSLAASLKARELPPEYFHTVVGAFLSDWDDLNDFECDYSRPLPSYAWE